MANGRRAASDTPAVRAEPAERRRGRLWWLCATLGIAFAGALVWLGFYAAGHDSNYAPTPVSRWEHGERFVGAPALVGAFSAGVASMVVLLLARWSALARWAAFPAVLLAPATVLFVWFGLTAGH